MQIKLSILIRSIESRSVQLSSLVTKLVSQCGQIKMIETKRVSSCSIFILQFNEVEIIFAVDRKEISSGEKANILLDVSCGTWIAMVDDDDDVADCYISEILNATTSGADCFATRGTYCADGGKKITWYLSKDFPNDTARINGEMCYRRTTNHISPVKRELALQARFPKLSNAEDKAYSEALNPLLKTEYTIPVPLYFYNYSSHNKEY